MSEKNKILGICLAKLQDRIRTEYLNAINRAASVSGWKAVTYNSFRDFRKNDLCVQGSKSIYNIVNYNDIDVLVVFPESMNRSEIADDLIAFAQSKGKPVISIGPNKPGCFSIIRDYDAGFKDLMNHVIDVHGAKKTFFVGGFSEDDERTVLRVKAYREVLEAHGFAFNENMVDYGDYKDEIINNVMDRLMGRGDVPQAIFCIDDKTAIQVCEKLSEFDLKVPDDVIVTGFGGIPAAYYYHPSISSCSDDVEVFAQMVIQAAEAALSGEPPKVYKNPFKARIRRSCGCDMRSYLSAGRREYDLAAAKAAGICVIENENEAGKTKGSENIETAEAAEKTEQQNIAGGEKAKQEDTKQEDTIFMPDAVKDGTVIIYKKYPETEDAEGQNKEETNESKSEENADAPADTEITPSDIKFGIKPEEIPEYTPDKLKEAAASSDPRLAEAMKGGYDISYGSGRCDRAADAKSDTAPCDISKEKDQTGSTGSGESANKEYSAEEQIHGMAKIYPSDIFRKRAEERTGENITGCENSKTASENNSSDPEVDKAAKRAMEVAEDKRCIGGHGEARFRSGNHVAYIYKELDEIERREDSTLAWMDRMLELGDIESICDNIAKRLPKGSALYIFTKLIDSGFDIDGFVTDNLSEESLTVIESKNGAGKESGHIEYSEKPTVKVKHLVKDYIMSDIDGSMMVFNPVFIGDFVCGYYMIRTAQLNDIRNNTKLLCTGLNMVFRFLANQNRQQQMLYNIENSTFVSSMTGLPNLKGLTRWFETFSAEPENHAKALNISVFSMPRYTYIYENYGLNEIEESVRFIVDKIRSTCPRTSFIGQFAEGEFVAIDSVRPEDTREIVECEDGTEDTVNVNMEEIFHRFDKIMEEHNRISTKEYFLEVNYGTSVVEEGWNSSLESMVRMAVSDMYLRRLRQGRAPVIRDKTFDREYFATFELLVDRNLFRYHFQPIVDAGTGKIYAYEALMRTGGGISMSPLDVLEIAKNAQRLYDIEKATLFNVLKFYEEHLEEFGDKKLFINTIPGYFLNDQDRNELIERYGKYIDAFVFEVTESNTVTDDELEKLRKPAPNGKCASVAVDDFGTGHSNIVNLIRYTPEIIKIDRYLISNIQDDSNKQMFVKNTIEFAALNGIKVLAEGVETSEELRKVIEYGVDFIQGYYTAHPEASLMQQIPQNIRSEILNESIKASKFDNENMVYNAKSGETINLLELTLQKYTSVFIPGGKVKIVGEPGNTIDMIIRTADNRKADITFENVNIRGELETTVQLGRNTETSLTIMGECTLNKDGILVPSGSRLTCTGPGNLHIITSRNLSIGIGSNCNEPHGDLSFDMTGTVKIVANGDKVVGIGGGRCDGSRIRLINGYFDISAKAIHAVAIGSDVGDTDIYIGRNVSCRLKCDGNESIALGSINGKAEIVSRGRLDVTGDGEKTVGIGSIYGFAKIDIVNHPVSVVLHSFCGMGIGSLTGKAELTSEDSEVNIYAEGTQINGIGSGEDYADTQVSGGKVRVEILAGIPRSLGSQRGTFTLKYGSFTSMHDLDVNVKDEHGLRIMPKMIENGVLFER
ncbi:MAG: EAL domain-containing protein [Lachnospiraceae bacterium]|nr:EAL domain-containing protein [Lachnospiraceae bacterium]